MPPKREIKECIFDIIKSDKAKEIINVSKTKNKEGFGNWSLKKLIFLDYYLPAYLNIIKNNGFKTFFIDFFSGSGANETKECESNKITSLGSPIVSLFNGIKYIKSKGRNNRFDRWFFIDYNKEYCEALRKRVLKTLEIINKNFSEKMEIDNDVKIICGDCNLEMENIVKEIKREEGKIAVFAFIDPYSFKNLEWNTLKKLFELRIADIIFTFPLYTIRRGIKNCKIPEKYLPPSLSERIKEKGIRNITEFGELYAVDIVKEIGRSLRYYKKGITVRNVNNSELYRIEFFTHAKEAHRICSNKADELDRLSNQNLKFIVDQVMGKQKAL